MAQTRNQREKTRSVTYSKDLQLVLVRGIRELKHARFWDADGNQKWAVSPFNLSSDNHIYIAKYLFSIRDDSLKRLGDTTVLVQEMSSSGCRPPIRNARAWARYLFHSSRPFTGTHEPNKYLIDRPVPNYVAS